MINMAAQVLGKLRRSTQYIRIRSLNCIIEIRKEEKVSYDFAEALLYFET